MTAVAVAFFPLSRLFLFWHWIRKDSGERLNGKVAQVLLFLVAVPTQAEFGAGLNSGGGLAHDRTDARGGVGGCPDGLGGTVQPG